MRTPAEILDDTLADNLRLVAENLRLRSQRHKLRKAFARYVNTHFLQQQARKASIRLSRETA